MATVDKTLRKAKRSKHKEEVKEIPSKKIVWKAVNNDEEAKRKKH